MQTRSPGTVEVVIIATLVLFHVHPIDYCAEILKNLWDGPAGNGTTNRKPWSSSIKSAAASTCHGPAGMDAHWSRN
jgi:hypothetical protein